MVTLKFGSAVCSALTEAAASGRSSSRGLLLGVAGEAALWVLWQPQKLPNLSEDELNAVRQSLRTLDCSQWSSVVMALQSSPGVRTNR